MKASGKQAPAARLREFIDVEAEALGFDAVAVTRENAEFNEVSGALRAATTPIEDVSGRFELVLANIQASVLVPLAEVAPAVEVPGHGRVDALLGAIDVDGIVPA